MRFTHLTSQVFRRGARRNPNNPMIPRYYRRVYGPLGKSIPLISSYKNERHAQRVAKKLTYSKRGFFPSVQGNSIVFIKRR